MEVQDYGNDKVAHQVNSPKDNHYKSWTEYNNNKTLLMSMESNW